MEALKIYDKAKDGYLKVAVPKEFEGKVLEINVKVVEKDEVIQNEAPITAEQRGKAIMAGFGTAKFKDYVIRKDESYYQ